MKVRELIEVLLKLDQDKEIKYQSYEFVDNLEVETIYTVTDRKSGDEYYCMDYR